MALPPKAPPIVNSLAGLGPIEGRDMINRLAADGFQVTCRFDNHGEMIKSTCKE